MKVAVGMASRVLPSSLLASSGSFITLVMSSSFTATLMTFPPRPTLRYTKLPAVTVTKPFRNA